MRGVVGLSFLLSACSGSISFGPPTFQPPPAPVSPGPQRVIVESTGQVVTAPLDPIEVTIEGLSQAQTVRSLVKQLSRP